jgi:acetyl esterase/lipase
MPTKTEDFTTQDIDYLQHGERSLRLRLFRPAGAGPFPLVVDLHGGAWNKNDLTACQDRDEVLARAGLAVAALDFRHAGDGYLASMEDINYGLRWLKAHGAEYGIDGARIGLCGQSSGGHLAMLSAMRPRDRRYTRIALDASPDVSVDGALDGAVRCVGMAWPVINPLSRYHHALRTRAAGDPAGWVGDIPECHDRYWVTEEIMAEGSPVVALESGEPVETPPALWVQGRPDVVHDYRDLDSGLDINEPERFAQAYRKAGGEFEILYIDQASRATAASSDPLAEFFRKHLS